MHALSPMVGILLALGAWWAVSGSRARFALAGRGRGRRASIYILQPLEKRGEMDQGIGLLAYYSLLRVARGFLLGIAIWHAARVPARGVEGASRGCFDPIIQVLRPISPLAWLPLGLILFQKSEPAALFAIAVCSMWPTVINTMQACARFRRTTGTSPRCCGCSSSRRSRRSSCRRTLPYMFTGYRLSLGIAWLVIVASEMLTGTPGVGGFLWQEYNSLIYAHILLAILTIGVVGFILDRLMGMAEARLRAI
jgi:nitrate/nitrite transport system permease protein